IAIQLRDAVGRLFAQQLGVLDRELETDVVHPALLRSHHPHLRAYAVSRPCQPRKWDAVRRCTPTRTQGTVLPAVARVCPSPRFFGRSMAVAFVKRVEHAILAAILVCCAGCPGTATTPRLAPAEAAAVGRPTVAPMLERVLPGVVNISTTSHVKLEQNPL